MYEGWFCVDAVGHSGQNERRLQKSKFHYMFELLSRYVVVAAIWVPLTINS